MLVAEDDEGLGEVLARGLREQGYVVDLVPDGEAAQLLHQVQAGQPGHAPVHHGHLVLVEAQVGGGRLAVGHQVHDVALFPQPAGQDFAQTFVVLRD